MIRRYLLWGLFVAAGASGCRYGEGPADAAAIPDMGADAQSLDRPTPDRDAPDSGFADAGVNDFEVQVGTGARAFAPVAPAEVVTFHAGLQGGGQFEGFHVWFAARARGQADGLVTITFALLDAADRRRLAGLTWQTELMPAAEGWSETFGAAPRISDCCLARDRPLIMQVRIVDGAGAAGGAEVEVRGDVQCFDGVANYCL